MQRRLQRYFLHGWLRQRRSNPYFCLKLLVWASAVEMCRDALAGQTLQRLPRRHRHASTTFDSYIIDLH